MTDVLPPAAQRVADWAATAGLSIAIRLSSQPTRTAEEAAVACECAVGQIVKSLVFRGAESGQPLLLLVSGAHRVDETQVYTPIGERLARADAAFVRSVTGYAIGGIPPFAHTAPLRTFFDTALLAYPQVWAAAGLPNSLFAIAPATLRAITQADALTLA